MKYLKSGNVCLGACGRETGLFDSGKGEPLFVGDIVFVWKECFEDKGWYAVPEYVAWNNEKNHPYIMGLASGKIKRELIHDGDIVCEESIDIASTRRNDSLYEREDYDFVYDKIYYDETDIWFIRKLKGWQQVAIGEIWNGVVMTEEKEEI